MGKISLDPKILEGMSRFRKNDLDKSRRDRLAQEVTDRKKRQPTSETGRKSSTDVIVYEHDDDDSVLVTLLKDAVNEAEITLEDMYLQMPKGKAWNYYYGLLTRRSTTIETFVSWADFLGYDVRIELVEKPRT